MKDLWLRLKALFDDAAKGEQMTIDRHTEQWAQKTDSLSEEELRERFPRAKQARD